MHRNVSGACLQCIVFPVGFWHFYYAPKSRSRPKSPWNRQSTSRQNAAGTCARNVSSAYFFLWVFGIFTMHRYPGQDHNRPGAGNPIRSKTGRKQVLPSYFRLFPLPPLLYRRVCIATTRIISTAFSQKQTPCNFDTCGTETEIMMRTCEIYVQIFSARSSSRFLASEHRRSNLVLVGLLWSSQRQ